MASLANQERFAIAAKDARDLFERTNGRVPVDVCRIARMLGYRVEEAEIRWAGYLATRDNIIVVRRSDIPTRKRFTVAHEIGHLLWWKACGESVTDKRLYKGRGDSEEERIANKLASELLMPMPEFLGALRMWRGPSFVAVRCLASLFGVSFGACVRRITELEGVVGFTYLYEVWSGESGDYEFRLRKGHSTGNELTFIAPPSEIARKCVGDRLWGNRTWEGDVRFRKGEEQIEIRSVGRLVAEGRQTCISLLGWTVLDSQSVGPAGADQFKAF